MKVGIQFSQLQIGDLLAVSPDSKDVWQKINYDHNCNVVISFPGTFRDIPPGTMGNVVLYATVWIDTDEEVIP